MKNIYVGNLDFNVSEDELRQAFAAYGQVDNVTILKDRDTGQPRGFGFVEMANDEEAEKAITSMNGYQLGSRALNVNEARPKTGGGGGGFSRGGGGGYGRGGGGGGGRGGNRGGGEGRRLPQILRSCKTIKTQASSLRLSFLITIPAPDRITQTRHSVCAE